MITAIVERCIRPGRHFVQFIYVSPQYDAVFVRNGPGRGDWGDRDWTQLFYEAAERL